MMLHAKVRLAAAGLAVGLGIVVTFAATMPVGAQDKKESDTAPPVPGESPVAKDWPQWGQNAMHTFAVADETLNFPLKVAWKYDYQAPTGGTGGWAFCPIVAHGTVYLPYGKGSNLLALDGHTGEVKWRSEVKACALATDGRIICGVRFQNSRYDAFVGVDAGNGTLKWTYEPEAAISRSFPGAARFLTQADGLFYGTSGDGTLYALDARDGTVRWSHKPEGGCLSSPAVMEGTVYLVSGKEPNLCAVNAATGEVKWKKTLPVRTSKWHTPTIACANNRIYVAASDATLCVDAGDGSQVWKSARTGTMTVTSRAVYSSNWGLSALDVATGKTMWRGEEAPHCAPATATGRFLWNHAVPKILRTTQDAGHGIVVRDALSGKVLWRSEEHLHTCWPVLVANGTAYVQREVGLKVTDEATGKEKSVEVPGLLYAFEPVRQ